LAAIFVTGIVLHPDSAIYVKLTGCLLFNPNPICPLSLSPWIIVIDGDLAVQLRVVGAVPSPVLPATKYLLPQKV